MKTAASIADKNISEPNAAPTWRGSAPSILQERFKDAMKSSGILAIAAGFAVCPVTVSRWPQR